MARSASEDELTLDLKADYKGQPIGLSGKIGDIRYVFAHQRFPLNLSGTLANTTVKVVGAIGDLPNLEGIDLELNGSGKDLAEIGPIIGQKLPTTDQFALNGRLTGAAKALSLKEVQGSASRDSLRFTVNGTVQDFFTLGGMDLQSRLTGKDLAEIGPLVGAEPPDLGPFDVSANLSGSSKAISLHDLSAMVDKSDFKGRIKIAFLKRPKMSANLESSVIDFTTLMKSLEDGKQKPADKDKQKARLFSDAPLPLDVLKKVNVDIVLKARNIHAKEARLDFGHMTFKLEDHDFSIDKLEATYKKTKISGSIKMTAGTPSRVKPFNQSAGQR